MPIMLPVNEAGVLITPKGVKKALRIANEDVLTIDVRDSEIVLRSSGIEKSPTRASSKMSLPLGRWDKIEKEIGEGAAIDNQDV